MYAVSTTHVLKNGLTFHNRFGTIQQRTHPLNVYGKKAVHQNLPYFDDKTVINKCHDFIKCHARLISVFVRLGLLRRILCLLQVKETNIRC